ncbi:MAG: FAD-dependent oxidoreductase [Thermodesulfobacteriota bacterium]
MSEKKILILGCGVSGLTSGIRLLENGFDVEIVAHSLPPNTTSNIAAAYWYPYKVSPEDKVLGWAGFSYNKFQELSQNPDTGVSIFELVKLFSEKVDDPFWKPAVESFRRAEPEQLSAGYVDGFIADVPIIETPLYMKYLVNRFQDLEGEIEKLDKEIDSLNELIENNKLVINCSGLGARKVCNDKNTFPIRGQIAIVSNPGINRCISVEVGPRAPIYVVPRSEDCILGGTAEENNWSLEIDPGTADEILEKCTELEPGLAEAEILEHKVGLRPGRTEVRLELEHMSDGQAVIHNYGHGGTGFTLSWGCAEEVLNLAENFIRNHC